MADFTTAFGKEGIAYQKGSFVAAMKGQAGLSESEFNARYWDSNKSQALHGGKGKDSSGNILNEFGKSYRESYSTAATFGDGNKARGYGDFVYGNGNVSDGSGNLTGGNGNTVDAIKSFTGGESNEVVGDVGNAITYGQHLTNYSGWNKATFGQYNRENKDNILEVGGGESESTRKNIFEVGYNGNLHATGVATFDKGAEISKYLSVPDGSIWASGEIKANHANPAVSLKPFDDRAGIRFSNTSSTDNYIDIVHYNTPTGKNEILVPDKSGTLALKEDIPARVLTETVKELVPTTTVVFAEDTDHNTGLYVSGKDIITFSFVSTGDITKGDCKYIVTWDGKDYEVYEEQFSAPKYDDSGKQTTFYDWQNLGNANNDVLDGYSPRTQDLPFAITQDRWENAGEVLVYAIGSTATQHTIAVKRVTGTYTRLTPEYYWNDQGYLRRGKGTSSAYVGLNNVDSFSSFAVGDGNKIRGTGHATTLLGGGNVAKQISYSIVSGFMNELSDIGAGGTISGYANVVTGGNRFLASQVFGAQNNISLPDIDNLFVAGLGHTIKQQEAELDKSDTPTALSVFGSANNITLTEFARSVGSKISMQSAVINGVKNNVDKAMYCSTLVGSFNEQHSPLVFTNILGSGNTLTNTEDGVEILQSNIIGMSNTVSGAVSNSHIVGDGNTIDGKKLAYVFGRQNTVDRDYQHVEGKFSAPDETAVYKFGYGTKAEPKNLFTLHEDGSGTLAGAPQNENDIVRLKELNSKVETITEEDINALFAA